MIRYGRRCRPARYAALVHARTASYSAAARRLGVDRRTVKRWVEAES